MTFIEFPGFPDLYAQGKDVGNFAAKIADKAADFACDLYQAFPGAIIRTPIGAFNRGLMDSLCGPRGKLPPAPNTPPFPGGQCPCVEYIVSYTAIDPANGADQSGSVVAIGPIGGVQRVDESEEISSDFLIEGVCNSEGEQTGSQLGDLLYNGSPGGKATITSVVRVDGEADSCGDPPGTWDPSLPDEIPDGSRSGDTVINNNDGTSITLPIAIIGSGNVVNLSPEFKVDVGGVEVTFDLGGVKIDFGSKDQDPALPPPRNNSSADNFERIEREIRNIREKQDQQQDDLDQIKKDRNDSPPPDEDPDIEQEEDEEESDSGDKEVDKLQYVCIHLTKLPNRVQWGDGAPNVYYAGWLEFRVKDCLLPRQPIHFANSIFKAPDGATGFAYTLTNGAKGKVTVYKSKS